MAENKRSKLLQYYGIPKGMYLRDIAITDMVVLLGRA